MEKTIKVLAIGAHADECQCCMGGVLRLLQVSGCDCTILHVANRNHFRTPEQLEVFDQDISRSCEILGVKEIVIGSRESSLYDGDGNDRKLIMQQLEAIQPDIVFIMWPQDSHPEHRRVARTSYDAILNSFWDQKLNCIREIYAYESCPNQTMQYFIPDFYIKIEPVKDILKDCIENCIAGKGQVLWQRKVDKGYFRGWCSDFGHVLTEAFKVIKFPGKTGMDGSDLLLRRLLADHFKWAGSSAWPYGNIYFQH